MITEIDEIRTKNTFDIIDASSLDVKLKADLKESLEESKLNLNGRTLEERCAAIARNQFDMTRFIVDIIIQFREAMARREDTGDDSRHKWDYVLVKCRWPLCVLGSVISVCCIFNTEIVGLLKAIVKLF